MKKQLLTLSELVDKRSTDKDDYSTNAVEAAEYWMDKFDEITKHNTFLKTTLTLGDFVPCDSEGKPLSSPEEWDECSYSTQMACGQDTFPCECAALYQYKNYYQAAKNAVIFEGFEIKKRENPEWNYFGSSDYLMSGFHCESNIPNIYIASIIDHRDIRVIAKNLETRADLATATQSNPLTLKTETK